MSGFDLNSKWFELVLQKGFLNKKTLFFSLSLFSTWWPSLLHSRH